jgi:hypothetical protein
MTDDAANNTHMGMHMQPSGRNLAAAGKHLAKTSHNRCRHPVMIIWALWLRNLFR